MPKLSRHVKPTPKVIGIVGSRRRDTDEDYRRCVAVFERVYRKGDKIVSGGCPEGGDKFAEIIAKAKGITIIIHYPDWSEGKFAGFGRNTTIADDCDVLIAVVAEDRTGGTEDTVKKVLAQRKMVLYV